MRNGVMQGSAHGPICFNLYYDIAIRLLNQYNDDLAYDLMGNKLVTRVFADDLLLLANSKESI